MFAAQNGHTATCEALVRLGAELEAKNNIVCFVSVHMVWNP